MEVACRSRIRRARFGAAMAILVSACLAGPIGALAQRGGDAPQDIVLTLKSHFRLAFDKAILRMAVGNPDILDATLTERSELLLLGKAPGRTSLMLWMQGESAPQEYAVTVAPDAGGLSQAYDGDPELSDVRVKAVPKGFVLSGSVETTEAHRRATRLAKGYLGAFVDDIMVLQRQMVSVEVRFAAMSVSALKKLGFNFNFFGRGFQVALAGPGNGTGFTFAPDSGLDLTPGLPIGDAFNLFLAAPRADFLSVLSALSGTRLAQVLAEPTLLVRSGEKADFISGGEIPVPVPQGDGAIGIEYRKFGIQLALAATVLSPKRIAMRVAPLVSELDFARAVTIGGTEVPAITTRGATTTIEIGDGQSFVLAGLMSSTQSDSEQKVPFIGDLPILGAFFKQVNNTRERQELVIVATPRLVNPVEPDRIPPLPGFDTRDYDPSFGDMLLNRNPLDEHVLRFGLKP